ncbi:hypothetical protein AOQ84DRAFT_344143 [Glonium stellatum]|uniref:Uncharacterized protein n=1 Tax=Glonium stellatum TaxID=574774 RepID=A0A8E2EWH4_9PEZI|nr:hypothetical protein AOQ84DRAFT_344143 [Glonium stellatum]
MSRPASRDQLPTRLPDTINSSCSSTIAIPTQREIVPDSQESFVSASSSTFTAPRLLLSPSNISNSTAADTEFTSPTSSNGPSSQSKVFNSSQPIPPTPNQTRRQHSRPAAPVVDTDLRNGSGNGSGGTATSPMSVDTPLLTQGSKRTASGTVKTTMSGILDSPMRAPPSRHSRNTSIDSNMSRIGEVCWLSAQLKTRLSYAMVKVQNGWERHTIEELEELPSQRGSPIASSGNVDAFRRSFDSPRISDRRRRPSGVSENSDQYMASPGHASPTGISPFWRSNSSCQPPIHTHFTFTASTASTVSPAASGAPALAPAADIVPRRNRRSNSNHVPPMLSTTHRKHYSDLGVPTTPTAGPRAGILRMPSQQAEKDAVDTLLFMSSPNNSSRLAHTSADAQPSPLRSEFPVTKRVVFESRNGRSSEPDERRTAGQGEGQNSHYKMAYSPGATAIESDDEISFRSRKR